MSFDPGATLAIVRERKPLVHNITNYVVMNETANATLALGALPVMAHAKEEVAEMVALAGALVLNIGTLSELWIESMLIAGKAANECGVPVVLDPVGAGATGYRTRTAQRLLDEIDVAVLRGNAGEIATLVGVEAVRHRAGRQRLGRRTRRGRVERPRAARLDHRHRLHVDRDHGLLPGREGGSVRGGCRGARRSRRRR
jgi:hypothetical protein